jgi:hypothetical protein
MLAATSSSTHKLRKCICIFRQWVLRKRCCTYYADQDIYFAIYPEEMVEVDELSNNSSNVGVDSVAG